MSCDKEDTKKTLEKSTKAYPTPFVLNFITNFPISDKRERLNSQSAESVFFLKGRRKERRKNSSNFLSAEESIPACITWNKYTSITFFF